MKSSLSVIGLVLAASAACVACDKLKSPQPELQKPPATSAQSGQPDDERQAFAQTAQKELDALKATVAEFKAKAEASSAKTRAKLGEDVKKLEADLGETEQRLTALKAATVESWSQLKESFSRSMEKLKNGVETFRKTAT